MANDERTPDEVIVDLRVCLKGVIQQRDEARDERDEVKSALRDLLTKCTCSSNDCIYHEYARVLVGVER